MTKKLIVVLAVSLALVFSVGSIAFANISWWHAPEHRGFNTNPDDNNTQDDSRNFGLALNGGNRVYGVCSSADTVDWYSYRGLANGILSFEFASDINADITLHRGAQVVNSYDDGGIKKITNYYVPPNTEVFIKVRYISGVPTRPYELRAKLEGFSRSKMDSIINKEDIDVLE